MLAAPDSFEGVAAEPWWSDYQGELVDVEIASGRMRATLLVGGASGSHWYNERDGWQRRQRRIRGDFDVAMLIRVYREDAGGVPTNDGTAKIAALMARDPRSPGGQSYVHRGIGRAPGMDAGTVIVDEHKSTAQDVSDWNTLEHPDQVTAQGWVRISRVGDTFTSYRSTDGRTWTNPIAWDRPDMPEVLDVGPVLYAEADTPDLAADFYDLINVFPETPSMSNTTAVQVDILQGITEGSAIAVPAALWAALSTTTPNQAGGNVTEPTAPEYGRLEVTTWGSITQAGGRSQRAIAEDLDFGTASEAWGQVTHVVLYDDETAGDPWRVLTIPAGGLDVGANDQVVFPSGSLVLSQG